MTIVDVERASMELQNALTSMDKVCKNIDSIADFWTGVDTKLSNISSRMDRFDTVPINQLGILNVNNRWGEVKTEYEQYVVHVSGFVW